MVEQCPPEVLDLICEYSIAPATSYDRFVQFADNEPSQSYNPSQIQRFRLVNQAFNKAALRFHYENIAFAGGSTTEEQERLYKIAQGENARHVRGLHLRTLPRQNQYYLYENTIRSPSAELATKLSQSLVQFRGLSHLKLGSSPSESGIWYTDDYHVESWLLALDQAHIAKLETLDLANSTVVRALAAKLNELRGLDETTNHHLQPNIRQIRHVAMKCCDALTTHGGLIYMYRTQDIGDWSLLDPQLPNLEVLEIDRFRMRQRLPFVGRPLQSLRLSRGEEMPSSELIKILAASSSTLTELVLNKIELSTRSSIEVYRFIQSACKRLTILWLDIEHGSGYTRLKMCSDQGNRVGECVRDGERQAAYASVFEQVDKNRFNAGMEAVYHPVLDQKAYDLVELKRAMKQSMEPARFKVEAVEN